MKRECHQGWYSFFPSESILRPSPWFVSQEADLHHLIQGDSLTLWLPGGFGQCEVSFGDQNLGSEVGVFISLLPHSRAADLPRLSFCCKVTELTGWFFSSSCSYRFHCVSVNAPSGPATGQTLLPTLGLEGEREETSSCPVGFSLLCLWPFCN